MNAGSTSSPPANRALGSARAAKQDEFYTQLPDIANEVRHYKEHLRGKTILCNCDDPFESNFFKYFALNFSTFGIKKLIATSYEGSPIAGAELPFEEYAGHKPNGKQARLVEINEVPDLNDDGAIDLLDVEQLLRRDANTSRRLYGNGAYGGGDFRSRECIEILKQADIVVTNPPFSLFREYVAQFVDYEKRFLIIGNKNAITYKEFFKLIQEDRIWIGVTPMGVDLLFDVPEANAKALIASGKEGSSYKIVNGVVKGRSSAIWFTNLDNTKRHEFIPLYRMYSPAEYPNIDNYDAINVDKVVDIPRDYGGRMGVPITFLDRYNPDQFEILAITKTWLEAATKTYPKQVQVSKDGRKSEVTKLNDGPALRLERPPIGETYYTIGDAIYTQLYQRLIIKRK
ncbi:MAG: adenine-specific methyltransferase EcoRI family protein [Armatimonadetes bacterium]|nr:adenine-specific methyltransferase EcoRI family protein [Armatimonadota bacterium]